jgi:hypothetical protein
VEQILGAFAIARENGDADTHRDVVPVPGDQVLAREG